MSKINYNFYLIYLCKLCKKSYQFTLNNNSYSILCWLLLTLKDWPQAMVINNERGCLLRAQEPYFSTRTTMKYWNLLFLDILSVDISVADQTRPTLWILVKNWGFFSSFTKISWFSTFTWVIPKKYRKKTVQFSFCHRMLKFWSKFKKSVSFDIGKVWAIRIHRQNLGNFRRFRAIFAKNRKIDPVFLQNPPKIAPNRRFSNIS